MTTCPLCNDSPLQVVRVKSKRYGFVHAACKPCICYRSKGVTTNQNLRLLAFLGDEYLPPEEIDPQLDFDFDNLSKCPNYIIKSSYDSLCLNVKGIVLKNEEALIYACRSIDILHNFYVEQADGGHPKLSDTDKYDLMVITLDTEEKNLRLKNCIAQVVYSRRSIKKPTWLYQPKASLAQCVQEYSPELEMYLESYKTVTLADKRRHSTDGITKSKQQASRFGRNT